VGEAQIISLSNHFLSSSRNFSLQFTLGKKKRPLFQQSRLSSSLPNGYVS
jgi:hypothetical protein